VDFDAIDAFYGGMGLESHVEQKELVKTRLEGRLSGGIECECLATL
jgi:hypothetical protein